jgi:uroporphyrinogen-III synthase
MTAKPARIRRVVITRSKQGNEELAARLKAAGFDTIAVDTISLQPPNDWSAVDRLIGSLHSFDWLVFTSAAGAEYFAKRMEALSLGLGWKGRPLVAAVGVRTAEKLAGLGIETRFIPSSYLTEKLAEELPAASGESVLLLRADIADPMLSKRLEERGLVVSEASIYATQLAKTSTDTRLSAADLIVFASPSAVRGFCGSVPKAELETLRKVTAVCIGPVTAEAARENGFALTIMPNKYTLESVVETIVGLSEADA